MLLRASNAVGYTAYPDNVVAEFISEAAAQGIDIFRIFDSLNWLPNMRVAVEAALQDRPHLRSRHLLHGRHSRSEARQIFAQILRAAREGTRAHGHAHSRHQGYGRSAAPYAAYKLVKTLREEIGLPIHLHTHDTSGINAATILKAAEAGVDVADGAISSMSGTTSQPNLNSIVAALPHTERDTGLDFDALNRLLRLLGNGPHLLRAVRQRAASPARRKSTCTKCRAANTPI